MLIATPFTSWSLDVDIAWLLIKLKISNQHSRFLIVNVNLTLHVLKFRVWTGFLINNHCWLVIGILSEISYRLLALVISIITILVQRTTSFNLDWSNVMIWKRRHEERSFQQGILFGEIEWFWRNMLVPKLFLRFLLVWVAILCIPKRWRSIFLDCNLNKWLTAFEVIHKINKQEDCCFISIFERDDIIVNWKLHIAHIQMSTDFFSEFI